MGKVMIERNSFWGRFVFGGCFQVYNKHCQLYFWIFIHHMDYSFGGWGGVWFNQTKCQVFQGVDDKSHKPDHINFSCPHVIVLACQPVSVDDLFVLESPCVAQNMFPINFQGGIVINEIMCGDGFWHIDQCPHNFVVQYSTLQKNIDAKCKCKINTHKMTSRTWTPCYSGFWA
jgi:hypothetical protein